MSNDNSTRVYTPASLIVHPVQILRGMWLDMVAGRGLAWQLAVRDIKAQYRQAFLGVLWGVDTTAGQYGCLGFPQEYWHRVSRQDGLTLFRLCVYRHHAVGDFYGLP